MCPKKYAIYVTLLVFVHRTAGLVGIKTGFWSFFPPACGRQGAWDQNVFWSPVWLGRAGLYLC